MSPRLLDWDDVCIFRVVFIRMPLIMDGEYALST